MSTEHSGKVLQKSAKQYIWYFLKTTEKLEDELIIQLHFVGVHNQAVTKLC